MIYAARKGYDKVVMYLSMRVRNVDIIDAQTGRNIFFHYLMK